MSSVQAHFSVIEAGTAPYWTGRKKEITISSLQLIQSPSSGYHPNVLHCLLNHHHRILLTKCQNIFQSLTLSTCRKSSCAVPLSWFTGQIVTVIRRMIPCHWLVGWMIVANRRTGGREWKDETPAEDKLIGGLGKLFFNGTELFILVLPRASSAHPFSAA